MEDNYKGSRFADAKPEILSGCAVRANQASQATVGPAPSVAKKERTIDTKIGDLVSANQRVEAITQTIENLADRFLGNQPPSEKAENMVDIQEGPTFSILSHQIDRLHHLLSELDAQVGRFSDTI